MNTNNNRDAQVIYDTIIDVFNYKEKLYHKLKNINIQDIPNKEYYLYINKNPVFEIGINNNYSAEHYLKFPKLELDTNNKIKEPTLKREFELFFKKFIVSNKNKVLLFAMVSKNTYNNEISRLNNKIKNRSKKNYRPPSPRSPSELPDPVGGNKSKLQTLKQNLKLKQKKEMDKLKTKQKNELLKLKNKQNDQLKKLKSNTCNNCNKSFSKKSSLLTHKKKCN